MIFRMRAQWGVIDFFLIVMKTSIGFFLIVMKNKYIFTFKINIDMRSFDKQS